MVKQEAGKQYGRLTVLGQAPSRNQKAVWRCLCVCGKEVEVTGDRLRSGITRSCGCLVVDNVKARSTTHGHTSGGAWTPTYRTWMEMKARCHRPSSTTFHKYGARGIHIEDPSWEDFSAFLADMGERPRGTTLDRIDNRRGYYKENCRWASAKEQSRNRSSCRLITLGTETKPLSAWCEQLGVPYHRAYQRIFRLGWSPRAALGLREPIDM